MSMIKVLYGLAALPLIAGVAFAEPVKSANNSKALAKTPTQLTDQQMDKVAAGWSQYHVQIHNTGAVIWSIYNTDNTPPTALEPFFGPNNTILPSGDPEVAGCGGCYLNISNSALSVASIIFGGPN